MIDLNVPKYGDEAYDKANCIHLVSRYIHARLDPERARSAHDSLMRFLNTVPSYYDAAPTDQLCVGDTPMDAGIEEFNYRLDPGIRQVVRWLRRIGYKTTDSGDGVSKPADERTYDVPHVVIRIEEKRTSEGFRWEALELQKLCVEHCLSKAVVEVHYSTADNIALLMLFPEGLYAYSEKVVTTKDGDG